MDRGPQFNEDDDETQFNIDDYMNKFNLNQDSLQRWTIGSLGLESNPKLITPYNTQFKWPKEYISQTMPRQAGADSRKMIHDHLDKLGLVDRSNPEMPMVTVRRMGKPRAGVTNASYHPKWGETERSSWGGFGRGKNSRENSGEVGVYEWKVPLEHVIGHGHPEEYELFVVHHPSTKVNRVR